MKLNQDKKAQFTDRCHAAARAQSSRMDARTNMANDRDLPSPAAPPEHPAVVIHHGRRLIILRRMAWVCTALVLMVICLSAFIRLSRAGLSCHYWPHYYGQSLLELQQGLPASGGENEATALARLAHRIVASTALLLVIGMVLVCVTTRPVRWREGRVALALLALALFLAVLGRWSSNSPLPAVAMGNLLGGFAMLALCWRLAWHPDPPDTPRLRTWAGLGLALLICQVLLGTLVSASYAATSCNSLADCIAASHTASWQALNPWREPVLASTPPLNASGALVQTVHRMASLFVVLVLLPVGLAAPGQGRRGPGLLLLLFLAVELALGLLLAGNGASLPLTLAHNLIAALLLATAFELTRGAGVGT